MVPSLEEQAVLCSMLNGFQVNFKQHFYPFKKISHLFGMHECSARGVASQLLLGQLQIHYLLQLNHITSFRLQA